MHIELSDVDSRVFGRNVLAIYDFDPATDFAGVEAEYVGRFNPAYVSCKIPLERVGDAHVLESHGFNLIECQIRFGINLRKPFPVPALGRYAFELVTREDDLDQVLDIAGTTFVDDRLSIDLALSPEISGRRYREFVTKSFRSPDEAVYRLYDREKEKTVAFKTHLLRGPEEVLFLLAGVHPDYKKLGIGVLSTYLELNALIDKGVKKGVTHISAANYPVFNLHISNLGFQVMTVFGVFRKLYG